MKSTKMEEESAAATPLRNRYLFKCRFESTFISNRNQELRYIFKFTSQKFHLKLRRISTKICTFKY